MRNLLRHIWHLPRKTIVFVIVAYQYTLSPDHGPLKGLFPYGCCCFAETCSMYGRRIITERGAVMGSLLTAKRVFSCHPWKEPRDEKILSAIQR